MRRPNLERRADAIRGAVRSGYARIAQGGCGCCGQALGGNSSAVSRGLGYGKAELKALPAGADMGLSCGNPTAFAFLKPGEVVLDLGAGGGLDVFLAGQKVGRHGLAIGVDMTPEMLSRARRNIAAYRRRTGLSNVEFRLGEIEHLPVADASVDVVISNCVINLSPDKPQVWREIARVLKSGGRVAVSDLALFRLLPPAVRVSASALVGCVAGAVLVSRVRAMVRAAGLTAVRFASNPGVVDAMTEWNDPLYRLVRTRLPAGNRLSDYVTSLSVEATKIPGSMRK